MLVTLASCCACGFTSFGGFGPDLVAVPPPPGASEPLAMLANPIMADLCQTKDGNWLVCDKCKRDGYRWASTHMVVHPPKHFLHRIQQEGNPGNSDKYWHLRGAGSPGGGPDTYLTAFSLIFSQPLPPAASLLIVSVYGGSRSPAASRQLTLSAVPHVRLLIVSIAMDPRRYDSSR